MKTDAAPSLYIKVHQTFEKCKCFLCASSVFCEMHTRGERNTEKRIILHKITQFHKNVVANSILRV